MSFLTGEFKPKNIYENPTVEDEISTTWCKSTGYEYDDFGHGFRDLRSYLKNLK
jgi:hypothetical protein